MKSYDFDKNKHTKQLTCTWDANSACNNCPNNSYLDCKWDKKHLIRFYVMLLPAFIPIIFGMILSVLWTGNWVGLIIYVFFWVFFFMFFEIWVLCRHCPYYSEEGIILHCLANHGLFKIWKYEPGPMNRWEKVGLLIGFFLLFGIPNLVIIFTILDLIEAGVELIFVLIMSTLGILSIGGIIFTIRYLTTKICSRCVNFSCPLNHVPKTLVDSYLMKNPTMRRAWEKKGYRLG